jgi:hypothetical protein
LHVICALDQLLQRNEWLFTARSGGELSFTQGRSLQVTQYSNSRWTASMLHVACFPHFCRLVSPTIDAPSVVHVIWPPSGPCRSPPSRWWDAPTVAVASGCRSQRGANDFPSGRAWSFLAPAPDVCDAWCWPENKSDLVKAACMEPSRRPEATARKGERRWVCACVQSCTRQRETYNTPTLPS